MVQKLFGTDGIRGTANLGPMTAEIALKVGMAAGHLFSKDERRNTVLIGKDTRLSGYMLESALVAGFIGMGMDVFLVGPMPTPAIAMLTRSLRCDLGVVISASHNPFEDNGIKLLASDGHKISQEEEVQIEKFVFGGISKALVGSRGLGRAKRLEDAEGRYIEFAKNTFPRGVRLDGLKIVIDCAHGSAYKTAPTTLWELGADVIPIGVTPNGFNINHECGATNTDLLCETVVKEGAHIGIALDGDADRVFIADEIGNVIDGDQIMAIIAKSWKEQNRLQGAGIVGTVMSNLNLENFLQEMGLSFLRTQVGDKHVMQKMLAQGINIGGEQSGHIILKDYNTTGDGLIAALEVLAVLVRSGEKTSEISHLYKPLPQLLRNVSFEGKTPLKENVVVQAIHEGKKILGDRGRVLVRESGTEPVIRVMVEGDDRNFITNLADKICEVIERVSAFRRNG
ncbi:MAG: phosphoglucosamine mutase [Pseudomonadota bacterium]|nr:phosphoglucosamine mutase [Pseudomonadota bacterium]